MQTRTAHQDADEFGVLLALLRVVCDEMHAMARDITRLGETLSHEDQPPQERIQCLQSFDPISQRALAHERILRGIERILGGYSTDWKKSMAMLIQLIPFHADRQRLQAILSGEEAMAIGGPADDDEDLDLF